MTPESLQLTPENSALAQSLYDRGEASDFQDAVNRLLGEGRRREEVRGELLREAVAVGDRDLAPGRFKECTVAELMAELDEDEASASE